MSGMVAVMPALRRVSAVMLAGLLFGFLVSAAKGSGGGLRLSAGNISAPWLAVGFVAGASYRGSWQAALAGLLATFAALVGFYVQTLGLNSLTSHIGGPGGLFEVIVGAHRVYFVAGVLSGTVFGVLGSLWRARRIWSAAAVLSLAFLLEPIAQGALGLSRNGSATAMLSQHSWLWGIEALVGGGMTAFVILRGRRQHEQNSNTTDTVA